MKSSGWGFEELDHLPPHPGNTAVLELEEEHDEIVRHLTSPSTTTSESARTPF
jgi:hypothetical protein